MKNSRLITLSFWLFFLTELFQLIAALLGWQMKLWSESNFPRFSTHFWHCDLQLQHALTNKIVIPGMSASFSCEAIFNFIINLFCYFTVKSALRPFPNATGSYIINDDIFESNKDFKRVAITIFVLVFFVDGVRYFFTSIFAINKFFYTWSSFCVCGPRIYILNEISALFEAALVGIAFATFTIALGDKYSPEIELWHPDTECGTKDYGKAIAKYLIGLFLLTGVDSLLWGFYAANSLGSKSSNDFSYLATPIFVALLVTGILSMAVTRAGKLQKKYEYLRGKEVEKMQSIAGGINQNSYSNIAKIPKDPMEQYLGRYRHTPYQKYLIFIIVPIVTLSAYLIGYSIKDIFEQIVKLVK